MKNKIKKILEYPKIIISVVFFIAIIIGALAYKFVGYAPKINNNDNLVDNRIGLEDGATIDLAFPKTGRINAVYVKQGDIVKKGQILANLDFTDAQGALEIAKANYQKMINGAIGADIDLAKAAVQTAQVNLDTVIKQQDLAVKSAYRNLLNSTPEALPTIQVSDYVAPIVTGNYILDKEGDINLTVYNTGGTPNFLTSGIIENSTGIINANTSQPLGNSGLYIKFPQTNNMNVSNWTISIPNKKAANYIPNYNAYLGAQESQKRLVEVAQANLDQANKALAFKVASARPEDVAAATGALAVAQGAYDNDFIYAPVDGLVSAVNLNVGEIASANQRVVSLIAENNK